MNFVAFDNYIGCIKNILVLSKYTLKGYEVKWHGLCNLFYEKNNNNILSQRINNNNHEILRGRRRKVGGKENYKATVVKFKKSNSLGKVIMGIIDSILYLF